MKKKTNKQKVEQRNHISRRQVPGSLEIVGIHIVQNLLAHENVFIIVKEMHKR